MINIFSVMPKYLISLRVFCLCSVMMLASSAYSQSKVISSNSSVDSKAASSAGHSDNLSPFAIKTNKISLRQSEGTNQVWVSTIGNDSADGTINKPLRTLKEAISRTAKLTGPQEIILRQGVYSVEESLVIDGSKQWLPSSLKLCGYSGETVVISAGKPVTGWYSSDGKLFAAKKPAGAQWPFLWNTQDDYSGNSDRLHPSRHPNLGDLESVAAYEAPEIISWHHTHSQLQLPFSFSFQGVTNYSFDYAASTAVPVYPIRVHLPNAWTYSQLPVLAYSLTSDNKSVYVSFRDEAGRAEFINRDKDWLHGDSKQRFYLTFNHPDKNGEYTFNSKYDCFVVYSHKGLSYLKGVVSPALETIIQIRNAKNLRIENLRFMHTGWKGMENGYVSGGYDNFVSRDGNLNVLPSALSIERTSDVIIKNVGFVSMGTSALDVKFCERVEVVGNYFKDVGGLGVKSNFSGTVRIADNIFHQVGNTYGIGSVYDYGTCFDGKVKVQNNLFYGSHGNSIAVLNDATNSNQEHLISNNIILGSVQRFTDTGAVGGAVGRTKIMENVFCYITDSKWSDKGKVAAVYWDIGSFYNEAQFNVFKNVDLAFNLNCQGRNTIKNNYVSNVKQQVRVTFLAYDIGTFDNVQPLLTEELNRNDPATLHNANNNGTCVSSTFLGGFNDSMQYDWVISKSGPSEATLKAWNYQFSKEFLKQ